jgi:PadR family transcriptional regulator PadR
LGPENRPFHYSAIRSSLSGVDSSQLLKGVLPTTALALLARADAYGYQVLSELREAGLRTVGDASVYGTLQRLYDGGLLSSYLVSSNTGPSRRYYALTADGRAALKAGRDEWREFQTIVTALLTEDDEADQAEDDEEEAS